jgi:hypothetical protein
MKRAILPVIFVSIFIATMLSANGKTNKSHLSMKGKDGAKINCVYCHKTAKIPKKKGQDVKKYESSPFCGGKGCHPLPAK